MRKEDWLIRTENELRVYRTLQKRIEVINILLRKQCSPDAKAIASYGAQVYGGQGPDEIGQLEVELEAKQRRVEAIEKSIEALDAQEAALIALKHEQGYNDKEIYEAKLPMSSATFYDYYNRAIRKIAQCLGFLEC
jgi:DNA-directed RNA polymerase specialized sigma24 family protein